MKKTLGMLFLKLLNLSLQKMEDYGLIDRAMDYAFPNIKNAAEPATANVEVDDVAQTFILLVIGYFLALIILFAENIYWSWSKNNVKVTKVTKRNKESLLSFIK